MADATNGANGLAAAVRLARETAHLTQAELAARADVSSQTVSRIERGLPVAEDSVRAVAAALGIDCATLPRRPTRAAMPDEGGTDPHWRDLLAAVADSGEKAVASGRADRDRYLAMAATVRPRVATSLPPYPPMAWTLAAFVVFIGIMGAASVALGLTAIVIGRPAKEVVEDAILLSGAFPALAVWLAGVLAWAAHLPEREHDAAVEAMAGAMGAERHLVTDRAAYVARKAGDGTYSWTRMALPAPLVRRMPVDAVAPDVTSVTLEDASGRTLVLLAPDDAVAVAAGANAVAEAA